jgi:hypothetical protein
MSEKLCGDLSDHYAKIIEKYLDFTHHRTELHLKEISTVIQNIKDSR